MRQTHAFGTRYSEFSPTPGSKPQAIRLPSGEVRTAGSWADLTVAAVRWLHETGHLNESHLPIQRDQQDVHCRLCPATPDGNARS